MISVENLGKRYRVKRPGMRGGGGLRHAIEAGAASLWNGLGRMVRGRAPFDRIAPEDEFWALKDINFEVQAGECVGIIGRNGAGKSTLLKILSRITEPSAGRAVLRGRVGSLLEVGTGFHPELTGRENIFLNGAILGMRRHEIRKRMDAIVAFAEVDEFLDTHVKHYSSGMYMRLAFAVAAHLDPEILIVDEVLAVGDVQFQKKCMGKMSDVAKDGKTVIFVSHNLSAVSSLCKSVLYLAKGNTRELDKAEDVISMYLSDESTMPESSGVLEKLKYLKLAPIVNVAYEKGGGVVVTIELNIDATEDGLGLDLILRSGLSPIAFMSSAYMSEISLRKGANRIVCRLGPIKLAVGEYVFDAKICRPMINWIEEITGLARFCVSKGCSSRFNFELHASRNLGCIIPNQDWELL